MSWGLDAWGDHAWSYGFVDVTVTTAGVLSVGLGTTTLKIDATPTFADLGGLTMTLGSPSSILWNQVGTVDDETWAEIDTEFNNRWDTVVLLLNFEGLDAATTSEDESDSVHVLTFVSSAQIDTDQKKFGTSSLLVDGSVDSVTIPTSTDFHFGSGEFTVEFFVRFNTLPLGTRYQMTMTDPTDRGWSFFTSSGGAVTFAYSINGVSLSTIKTADSTVTTGQWYHYAVDRDSSGVLRIYIDGVVGDSETDTSVFNPTASILSIGAYQGGIAAASTDGWIDSVRITKGLARYGAAFTPPTESFSTNPSLPEDESWTDISTGTVTWTQIG